VGGGCKLKTRNTRKKNGGSGPREDTESNKNEEGGKASSVLMGRRQASWGGERLGCSNQEDCAPSTSSVDQRNHGLTGRRGISGNYRTLIGDLNGT